MHFFNLYLHINPDTLLTRDPIQIYLETFNSHLILFLFPHTQAFAIVDLAYEKTKFRFFSLNLVQTNFNVEHLSQETFLSSFLVDSAGLYHGDIRSTYILQHSKFS